MSVHSALSVMLELTVLLKTEMLKPSVFTLSEFELYIRSTSYLSGGSWQRELSKFASVQDRLREWNPLVRDKLNRLPCLVIDMLDIDGFRIDKGLQMSKHCSCRCRQILMLYASRGLPCQFQQYS